MGDAGQLVVNGMMLLGTTAWQFKQDFGLQLEADMFSKSNTKGLHAILYSLLKALQPDMYKVLLSLPTAFHHAEHLCRSNQQGRRVSLKASVQSSSGSMALCNMQIIKKLSSSITAFGRSGSSTSHDRVQIVCDRGRPEVQNLAFASFTASARQRAGCFLCRW